MLANLVRRSARRSFLTPASPVTTRAFHRSTGRAATDLPYHIVVGMPALSPTMESGTLAEWYVGVGDAISAGDGIAKIETDKASMDFEAQDDAFIAKLLAPPDADLLVGSPIMITVEDEADVAAFSDYVYEAAVVAAAPAVVEAPAAAAPVPVPVPAAPVVAAAPTPTPPVAEAAPAPVAASGDDASIAIPWARPTPASSPLAKAMSKQQATYMSLYGTTGQKAVVVEA